LVPAARCAGASGRVGGVDLSSAVVQEAEAALVAEGLESGEVRVMDAEHLDFEAGTFDFVVCAFGVRSLHAHVSEPRSLFAETEVPIRQVVLVAVVAVVAVVAHGRTS
jgi:ubiquinone/menaquinone biosynthesis C-methylase UbiE